MDDCLHHLIMFFFVFRKFHQVIIELVCISRTQLTSILRGWVDLPFWQNTGHLGSRYIKNLLETNSSPLKIDHPKSKLIFQPSIFRWELLVSGSVYIYMYIFGCPPFEKASVKWRFSIWDPRTTKNVTKSGWWLLLGRGTHWYIDCSTHKTVFAQPLFEVKARKWTQQSQQSSRIHTKKHGTWMNKDTKKNKQMKIAAKLCGNKPTTKSLYKKLQSFFPVGTRSHLQKAKCPDRGHHDVGHSPNRWCLCRQLK